MLRLGVTSKVGVTVTVVVMAVTSDDTVSAYKKVLSSYEILGTILLIRIQENGCQLFIC